MWNCKYCKVEFQNISPSEKANHSRWCACNPLRSTYGKGKSLEALRNGRLRSGNLNQFVKATNEGRVEVSKLLGRPGISRRHTPESKRKLSVAGLNSKHRRLVKSTRYYTKKNGQQVLLDSSWEEALAKRLYELCIEWERPDPIEWVDSKGIKHNYFPDFYLPDYAVYLDPKNKIAMELQKEKVSHFTKLGVKFLSTLDECKNYAPVSPLSSKQMKG